MKSRQKKKKHIKIDLTTIYKPVKQTHYCVELFLRLSREQTVKSMCYLKIYINEYLMHKTKHAKLVNRRRIDRNKIRSGDKIQNGCDCKFCRLTS